MFSPQQNDFSRPSVDPHRWRTSRGWIALATFCFWCLRVAQEPGNGQYAPTNQAISNRATTAGIRAAAALWQQSNPQQAYPEQSAPAQPIRGRQPEGPIDPQQVHSGVTDRAATQCTGSGATGGADALYPDAMVAQVLTAATYPEQVAGADRWRRRKAMRLPIRLRGANVTLDPSVKALTAYPQVLRRWTRICIGLRTGQRLLQPTEDYSSGAVLRQRAQRREICRALRRRRSVTIRATSCLLR